METEEELPHGGKVMSLWEHLGELRQRLVRSLLLVMVAFFGALVFSNQILDFLKAPLVAALPAGANALHFTNPLDVFLVGIKVSFFTSIIIAAPYWIMQFWRFLEPALYEHERRYVVPFGVASILLFLSGISFCFFLILPLALEFLLTLGMEVGTPIITVTDYISMLMVLIFGFGLVFETPLILILLSLLDLLDAEMLSKHRSLVAVIVLVVGAILTPPDPMSQIGMAIPLYLMYEISIIVIRALEKRAP
ncbi:MAG: twin-arginine translocase subunit TatC [Oligoflexales bacterium]